MVAPLFVYVSTTLYICPFYVNSHTGIRSGVLTPSVLFGPAAPFGMPTPTPGDRPTVTHPARRRAIQLQFPVPRPAGR